MRAAWTSASNVYWKRVAEAVGRGYYENGAPPGAGYRNGYRRGRLATAEGPIEYGVPQVADRAEPFASRGRAGLAGRTAELERLAVEMFARGLSTRDKKVYTGLHGTSDLEQRAHRVQSPHETTRPPLRVRTGGLRLPRAHD